MPVRTPASLTSPASDSSAYVRVARQLAFVRALANFGSPGDDAWLTACYHLTSRLQRLGRDAVLLDLGSCTDAEAVLAVQALMNRATDWQAPIRAAIGPSSTLAQLALLHAPAATSLEIVTSEQAEDLLRSLPVAALAQVRLAAPTPVTAELLAQLEGYGIHTLAQLSRLDEALLLRQFGARLGKLLALLARGEDLLPFQPTSAPLRLHYRLRLSAPITANRLLVGLPRFSGEVAMALARRGAQARTVELQLRWEHGALNRVTRTLPQPIAESRSLTEIVARLLTPLLEARSASISPPMVEDLRLILSDLSPRYPEQHAFWPQRAQRLTAAREVAETLARRHGKPLLFHRLLTSPDAIFDQNRSRPVPLDADVAETPASDAAWPRADVLSGEIPHGTHWW